MIYHFLCLIRSTPYFPQFLKWTSLTEPEQGGGFIEPSQSGCTAPLLFEKGSLEEVVFVSHCSSEQPLENKVIIVHVVEQKVAFISHHSELRAPPEMFETGARHWIRGTRFHVLKLTKPSLINFKV